VAVIRTLGRRGLPEGVVTRRAAGNSVVTSGVSGEAAAFPGSGGGVNETPVGGRLELTTPSTLNRRARAWTQHNRLSVRDRHVIWRRGRTTTSGEHQEPFSGVPNPEADGPAPPAYEMVDRSLTWQVGTDHTTQLDNDAPHASTLAGSRRFPLSNQGGQPYERVNGGTPGLYRPYGARGWVEGPEPTVISLPGGPGLPNKLVSRGSASDGPQIVSGGAPHGLHSPTVESTAATLGIRGARPQTVAGRQQRPANSKIAGQAYSQTVVNQDGSGGGPLPRVRAARSPGTVNSRLGR